MSRITAQAKGEPYALQFVAGGLQFCDANGSHKVDLQNSRSMPVQATCAKEDANTSCSGLSLDISVNAPLNQPDDVVDFGASQVQMKGRVHDCAVQSEAVAIATNVAVILLDATSGAISHVSDEGADRVAIDSSWVAWSNGSVITALTRASLEKAKPN